MDTPINKLFIGEKIPFLLVFIDTFVIYIALNFELSDTEVIKPKL